MLIGVFKKVAAAARKNAALTHAFGFGVTYGGGGMYVQDRESLAAHARLVRSGVSGVKGVVRVIDQIVNDIDARVDAMPVAGLLAAGESRLGSTPSPFVANPAIVTAENWDNFYGLSRHGLMGEGEVNAFCNLMGDFLMTEAVAARDYQQTRAPVERIRMAAAHVDLDASVMGMVAHIFRGKKSVAELADKPMRLSDLRGIYPAATALGDALQILDDFGDVIYDLAAERETGRPSPNIVLALAEKQERIYTANGGMAPAYTRLLETYRESAAPILLRDMPGAVQRAIPELRRLYAARAEKTPRGAHALMEGLWQVRMENDWSRDLKRPGAQKELMEAEQRGFQLPPPPAV